MHKAAWGQLKGIQIQMDEINGEANSIALSSRESTDEDRWLVMPSLLSETEIQTIDLYKNIYLPSLHESISTLTKLTSLSIVRCYSIQELPPSLGDLKSCFKQELDLTAWINWWTISYRTSVSDSGSTETEIHCGRYRCSRFHRTWHAGANDRLRQLDHLQYSA